MRVLAVIQARTGSTRLPGKVLADVGGRPLLAFMLERLQPLSADDLVVATTTDARDDPVAAVALERGVRVVRGPEEDVLGRFALACDRHPADAVVRLTADCPLLDPLVANQMIHLARSTRADYVSNTLVRTFPDGLDVEVVSARALDQAAHEATDRVEREHVTPFVYRRPSRFKLAAYRQGRMLGMERWTVDTAADLDLVRHAVEALGGRSDAGWEEILAVLGTRYRGPQLIQPVLPRHLERLATLARDADAMRVGHRASDPRELVRSLVTSLENPSVRAWSILLGDETAGCIVVDVDDAVGDLRLVAQAHNADLVKEATCAVQHALRQDYQVEMLTAGSVPSGAVDLLLACGFSTRDGGRLAWRTHG